MGDSFLVSEDGSLHLLNGDSEVFALGPYGMIAADIDGNVTFALNPQNGQVAAASGVVQDDADLSMDALQRDFAQQCTRSSYSNPAAVRACDAQATDRLIDRFNLQKPTARVSTSAHTPRPGGVQ